MKENANYKKLVLIKQGDKKYVYPSHFHRRIELFILKKGSYKVGVNKNTYELNSGDVLFLDSFAVHSYIEPLSKELDAICLLIPRDYAVNFFSRHTGTVLKPVISNNVLTEKIYSLAEEFILNTSNTNVQKGATELIFSMLENELIFSKDNEINENTLILDMLVYIEKNLNKDLTLPIISKALGYSNAHISRTFKKYVNSSIPEYVNKLRLEKVDELLKEKKLKKTDAIFLAGFNSYQTYYRIKSKHSS